MKSLRLGIPQHAPFEGGGGIEQVMQLRRRGNHPVGL
jgi:hypothetical protein